MEKYDVIIVGAGPGGLQAAKVLAEARKKVLLLEKNREIGPKICAGGLSRKCFQFLEIDPSFIELTHQSAIFNSPKFRTRLEFGEVFGHTVQRKRLGEWQLKKLEGLEVDIRTGAEVREITPEAVKLNTGEEIGYNYLIGADGSNSIVRRFLKLKTRLIGVAFHYLLPLKYEEIEIFFDSELFGPWYAWIFPYKDHISIGFGCFPRLMTMEKARSNFEKWLKMKNIDPTGGKFEAFPINCDYQGVRFGKTFLVGDAAGLVSGFTGEGIYQALVSGDEAARKIIDPKYRMPRIGEIRREVWVHHFMLGVVFLSGPLRNTIFDFITWAVRNKKIARLLARILT